nr:sodium:proton antiporter [Acuticoccus mangrovi]
MVIAASVVLGFAYFGRWLEGYGVLTEPLLCLGAGILLGPVGLATFDVRIGEPGDAFVHHAAEGVVGLAIMNAALRLEPDYVRRHWRSLAFVLTVGLFLMWVAAALALMVLPVTLATALLIAAIVTPTDPVLADSIVSGDVAQRNVPQRLRDAITAESAANDGLGYPFVVIAIILLTQEAIPWSDYIVGTILWEVCAATALGGAIGFVLGQLYGAARAHGLVETETSVPIFIAMTFVTLGAVQLMGADGILAVFTAGLAFRAFLDKEDMAGSVHFDALVDRTVTPLFFVLLGATLPFDDWVELGFPLLLGVVLVLLVRRLPAWLLIGFATPVYRGWRERAFAGWFGPVGVAAVFYVTLALRKVDAPALWPIVSAIIVGSMVVHGLTATPVSRWLGRHDSVAD